MGDCDLECAVLSRRHEFCAPVRVVLVETPPGEMFLRYFSAGATAWSVFLLGCTTLLTVISSFDMDRGCMISLHIFLCTVGVHTLLSVGVLTVNHLHGPAMVMGRSGRRKEHALTQFIALAYGGVGTWVLSYTKIDWFSEKGLFSKHSMLGLVGGGFFALAVLVGPLVACLSCESSAYKPFRNVHAAFGLVSLIMFSGSFLTGIAKPKMIAWFNRIDASVVYILMGMTCIGLISILFKPTSRF